MEQFRDDESSLKALFDSGLISDRELFQWKRIARIEHKLDDALTLLRASAKRRRIK